MSHWLYDWTFFLTCRHMCTVLAPIPRKIHIIDNIHILFPIYWYVILAILLQLIVRDDSVGWARTIKFKHAICLAYYSTLAPPIDTVRGSGEYRTAINTTVFSETSVTILHWRVTNLTKRQFSANWRVAQLLLSRQNGKIQKIDVLTRYRISSMHQFSANWRIAQLLLSRQNGKIQKIDVLTR